MASYFLSPDHTQRRTTVGRSPLDEWSARRRNLWQHTTPTTEKFPYPLGGIRTHNLSRRATVDLGLRPRGHWDWPNETDCIPPRKQTPQRRTEVWMGPRVGPSILRRQKCLASAGNLTQTPPSSNLQPSHHTNCAIQSLVIQSVFLQHTPLPHTHPRTPLLSYMQYMTKNYTLSGRKSTFGFDYTWRCSVTYHSGAREAKRDTVIT